MAQNSEMASDTVDQELVGIFNDAAHVFTPVNPDSIPDTVTAVRTRRPNCPIHRVILASHAATSVTNVFADVSLD